MFVLLNGKFRLKLHEEYRALKDLRKTGIRLFIWGAWFFAISTFLGLLYTIFFGFNEYNEINDHVVFLMSKRVGYDIINSWGLTYRGPSGMGLAIFEAIMVSGALWASMKKRDLVRRLGLIYLFGWSLLWWINSWQIYGWIHYGAYSVTYFTLFFMVCNLVRGTMEWRYAPPANIVEVQLTEE